MSTDALAKSFALLNDPKVLAAARFVLLDAGFPKHEIDDGVRELISRVFEYLQENAIVVETVERMCAIVRDFAQKLGVDGLRRAVIRGKASGGSTDTGEEYAAQEASIEWRLILKQVIETVNAQATDEERVLIEAAIAGTSQKAVAEKLDVSHGEARKKMGAMRERHVSLLRRRGFAGVIAGVIAAGAGAYFGFNALFGPDQGAQQGTPPALSALPQGVPTAPPSAAPEVPVDTSDTPRVVSPEDAKRATALRAAAHRARMKFDYFSCKKGYEAARELDPIGFASADGASDDYNVCLSKLRDLPNSKFH
ncbi:MAG TPA: hypothetical protein VGG39_11055 [Polyangiaceae bacterium]|jgi:hypothetical protein